MFKPLSLNASQRFQGRHGLVVSGAYGTHWSFVNKQPRVFHADADLVSIGQDKYQTLRSSLI